MKKLKDRILSLVDIFLSIKDKNLRWQSTNQAQTLTLAHERQLTEQDLAAKLTYKSVQLAHEIELLKTRQTAELTLLKSRCKEDINDYRQYLAALDQLKKDLQASFAHLPDAIALTIHHHAKSLLNTLWETADLEEKIKLERQLIQFIATAQKEAMLYRSGQRINELPNDTLQLLNQGHQPPLTH